MAQEEQGQFPPELQQVISKAAVDPEFRSALLADPRAAIDAELGPGLPPDLKLKFVEKDPDVDVMLVLPDILAAEELSAEELEAVSGGCILGTVNICWETAGNDGGCE